MFTGPSILTIAQEGRNSQYNESGMYAIFNLQSGHRWNETAVDVLARDMLRYQPSAPKIKPAVKSIPLREKAFYLPGTSFHVGRLV